MDILDGEGREGQAEVMVSPGRRNGATEKGEPLCAEIKKKEKKTSEEDAREGSSMSSVGDNNTFVLEGEEET